MFDAKKAQTDLRNAFFQVRDQLKVSKARIIFCVQEDLISELQARRLSKLKKLKALKAELQRRFRDYRMEGRVKSLASIFGKFIQGRTLFDAFGIRIIVNTVEEAYAMIEWLKLRYEVYEFEDKIANPKANGYRDLKLVVAWDENSYMEFIVQTVSMYVDSKTIQRHDDVYPWKYHKAIRELPVEYREIEF